MLQKLILENINNGNGTDLYNLIIEDAQSNLFNLGNKQVKQTQAFLRVLNNYPSMRKASKDIATLNAGLGKVFDLDMSEFEVNTGTDFDIKNDETLDPMQLVTKYNTGIDAQLNALKDSILVIGEWLNAHPAFSVGDKGILISDSFKQKYGRFITGELTVGDLTKGVDGFYKLVGVNPGENAEQEWVEKYTSNDVEVLNQYKLEWPNEKAAWEKLEETAGDTIKKMKEAAEENKSFLPDSLKGLTSKFKSFLNPLKKWLGRSDGPLSPKIIKNMLGASETQGLLGLKLNDLSEMIGNVIEVVSLVENEKFDTLTKKVWTTAAKEAKADEDEQPEEIQNSGLTEKFGEFFSKDGDITQQDKLNQLEKVITSYQEYLKNPVRGWEASETIPPNLNLSSKGNNLGLFDFISQNLFRNKSNFLFSEKELNSAKEALTNLGLDPKKEQVKTPKNIPPTKLVDYMQSLDFSENEIKWVGSQLQELGLTLQESFKRSLKQLLIEEVVQDDSIAYKLWDLASNSDETEQLADKIDANFDKLNAFFEDPNIPIPEVSQKPPVFKLADLTSGQDDPWKKLIDILPDDYAKNVPKKMAAAYKDIKGKKQNAFDTNFAYDYKGGETDDRVDYRSKNDPEVILTSAQNDALYRLNKKLEDEEIVLERWQRLAGILKD